MAYEYDRGVVTTKGLNHVPLLLQTQTSPCGFCGGHSGTVTGFPRGVLVFMCHYLHQSSICIHSYVNELIRSS